MTSTEPDKLLDRALGAYLGLAIGDALGATVEFMSAERIAEVFGVHRTILGGGWLGLPPGAVTDDTQMSLALGQAIISEGCFNLKSIAEGFVAWLRSNPPDCGNTCRQGIQRYQKHETLSAKQTPSHAGNGALMRNLPVLLSTLGSFTQMEEQTLAQSHFTHHHPLSDEVTVTLGHWTQRLILGEPISGIQQSARDWIARSPQFEFQEYAGPAGGYVVETAKTVLRWFFETNNFEDCLVSVVNRGGDADTTGAIAGMLAGARWGVHALPPVWLGSLDPEVRQAIEDQTSRLLALAPYNH